MRRRTFLRRASAALACGLAGTRGRASSTVPRNEVVLELHPTPQSPRNSEGSFVTLRDGRVLFAWWHFTGGGGDDSAGCLGLRSSDDSGRTWSPDTRILVPNEGRQTTGSVSLLRLASGRIALLYLVKNSFHDCRPRLRLSPDDGGSWTDPRPVIDAPGYFVVNNDRLVQLARGRLIVPAAYHRARGSNPTAGSSFDSRGIAMWWLSDDEGATWREARTWWACPRASSSGLQEPGVIELRDGRLFSWCRTGLGCQYGMYSTDGGETWGEPQPTAFRSPCSPLCIKRIPGRGDLLAVWNDHSGQFPVPRNERWNWGRTPLVAALSSDEGATWPRRKLLEDSPDHGFCYTAIHFVGEACLLAYCAGGRDTGNNVLARLRIRRIDLDWLYA